MSTRGAYGFIYNKEAKIMAKWADAYALPEMMLDFLNDVSFDRMVEIFNNLEKYENEYVLHDGFEQVIEIRNDYIYNSLFCEYAVVLDLDRKKFMLFEGFNKDKDSQHHMFYLDEPSDNSFEQYYACSFLCEFDFDDVPTNLNEAYEILGRHNETDKKEFVKEYSFYKAISFSSKNKQETQQFERELNELLSKYNK